MRVRFTQDFAEDLARLRAAPEPLAFVRLGERASIEAEALVPVETGDTWRYEHRPTRFSRALHRAIAASLEGYCLGIMCPRCSRQAHAWHLQHVRAPLERLTFACLFDGANAAEAARLLDGPAHLVHRDGDIRVLDEAAHDEAALDAVVDEMVRTDRTLFVSAGVLSIVLVHEYWRRGGRRHSAIHVSDALAHRLLGREPAPEPPDACYWTI